MPYKCNKSHEYDMMLARARPLGRKAPTCAVARAHLQILTPVHILETAHSIIGTPRPVAATGNTFTFLGNKPSDVVSMWPNWDHKTYTVEDMAVGMIRFETGGMLTLESSFVAHIPEDVFNIQIFGEKGGAIWGSAFATTDAAATWNNGWTRQQYLRFQGTAGYHTTATTSRASPSSDK